MSCGKALLIIDLQNDFCPGGALPVPAGNEIVPVLNKYIALFVKMNYYIIASRDWHPRQTKHFKKYGGEWPEHCIQETAGAQFHPDLQLPHTAIIISSGMNPDEEGYSAFEGVNAEGEHLAQMLDSVGVKELFVGGLATDYCVKESVLSALREGYKVTVLIDAVRGIAPHASRNAIEEMKAHAATVLSFDQLGSQL